MTLRQLVGVGLSWLFLFSPKGIYADGHIKSIPMTLDGAPYLATYQAEVVQKELLKSPVTEKTTPPMHESQSIDARALSYCKYHGHQSLVWAEVIPLQFTDLKPSIRIAAFIPNKWAPETISNMNAPRIEELHLADENQLTPFAVKSDPLYRGVPIHVFKKIWCSPQLGPEGKTEWLPHKASLAEIKKFVSLQKDHLSLRLFESLLARMQKLAFSPFDNSDIVLTKLYYLTSKKTPKDLRKLSFSFPIVEPTDKFVSFYEDHTKFLEEMSQNVKKGKTKNSQSYYDFVNFSLIHLESLNPSVEQTRAFAKVLDWNNLKKDKIDPNSKRAWIQLLATQLNSKDDSLYFIQNFAKDQILLADSNLVEAVMNRLVTQVLNDELDLSEVYSNFHLSKTITAKLTPKAEQFYINSKIDLYKYKKWTDAKDETLKVLVARKLEIALKRTNPNLMADLLKERSNDYYLKHVYDGVFDQDWGEAIQRNAFSYIKEGKLEELVQFFERNNKYSGGTFFKKLGDHTVRAYLLYLATLDTIEFQKLAKGLHWLIEIGLATNLPKKTFSSLYRTIVKKYANDPRQYIELTGAFLENIGYSLRGEPYRLSTIRKMIRETLIRFISMNPSKKDIDDLKKTVPVSDRAEIQSKVFNRMLAPKYITDVMMNLK